MNRTPFLLCALIYLSVFNYNCQSGTAPKSLSSEDGFMEIFDGVTLDGWEGDSVYWSVRDGALFGEITPETVVDRNTFIIWKGDMPADFELKAEYRVSANGNSGINYRSERVDEIPFALRGYQADLNGKKNLDGSNYEERRRSTLASQGEKVLIPTIEDPDSIHLHRTKNFWTKRQVTGELETKESLQAHLKSGDWNEYHLIIRGNRMQHIINGALMSEVIDEDSVNRRMDGLLGVQVHVGPPMTVEYRNIRIKDLKQ